MDWETHRLCWINTEIPAFMLKYATFDDFVVGLRRAGASQEWKAMAMAVAKERWGIPHVETLPR